MVQHRIVIDETVCQGHAQCQAAAPTLIELDGRGFGVVLNGGVLHDAAAEADAQHAARVCPERAISIRES